MIKARMGRVDAVKTNADIFPKSLITNLSKAKFDIRKSLDPPNAI